MISTKALKSKAAAGDPEAQFRLGYRLAFRRGHVPDWRDALRLWRSAAASGHTRAFFYAGTCYDFGQGTRKNMRLAVRFYRMAAIQGNHAAQYNLAFAIS